VLAQQVGPLSAPAIDLALSGSSTIRVDPAKPALPAPWYVGPDPIETQTRVVTEFLTQLPIERLQRVLGSPHALRLAEAGMGAAIVSYACTRSAVSAEAVYAGVQAIRFAGGDALTPHGFHVEPSVSGNSLALFVRRRL
jgi:hypothetical protein